MRLGFEFVALQARLGFECPTRAVRSSDIRGETREQGTASNYRFIGADILVVRVHSIRVQ